MECERVRKITHSMCRTNIKKDDTCEVSNLLELLLAGVIIRRTKRERQS